MRSLLKFARNADPGDETGLGKNALTGELSVRYQNDTYSFTAEDLYSDPHVSTDEMDAIQQMLA